MIISKKIWVRKKTQYGGDIVMFLPNKIIKNVGLAHGFKTINHVHGFKTICTWFLKPCAHGFKNHVHDFYAHGFKNHVHMVLKRCT